MNRTLSLAALSAALFVTGFLGTSAEAASFRVVRPNAAGGTTAVHGSAFQRANGATGGRAAVNTRNADGSATHRSALSANGSRGSIQSSGSASRDAAGNVTQSRSTSATNAVTGNSVQSSSSYSPSSGGTHSATCYNASGATIACR